MTEQAPPVSIQSRFHQKWVTPLLVILFKPLFFLLGPLTVCYGDRVPRDGGLLVLSNHLSDLDPPVVQLACSRSIHFMAKSELFDIPILGRIIRWFRAFPVKRGEADRTALRHALDILKAGHCVAVFPEGELSQDGTLQPLKPGIALLARQSEAWVICVRLEGTNRIMPYGKVFPRPACRRVWAVWSERRRFDRNATADEILAWAAERLRPSES